jgi:hypothetical protein
MRSVRHQPKQANGRPERLSPERLAELVRPATADTLRRNAPPSSAQRRDCEFRSASPGTCTARGRTMSRSARRTPARGIFGAPTSRPDRSRHPLRSRGTDRHPALHALRSAFLLRIVERDISIATSDLLPVELAEAVSGFALLPSSLLTVYTPTVRDSHPAGQSDSAELTYRGEVQIDILMRVSGCLRSVCGLPSQPNPN